MIAMKKIPIKILLVDDDEEEFFILQRLLKNARYAHYAFQWASNYNEGLSAILSHHHDAALVDYRLPESNGIELITAAMKQECKIPLILLTGQGSPAVDMASMAAGAKAYLSKGEFTAELLERTLRYAMEYKRDENRLKKLDKFHQQKANYDALTELGNRDLFHRALARALKKSARYQESVVILFLDLDNFKQVNDSLGHDMGDQLLQKVAMRLKKNIRETDEIFRLGGDEFTIILEGNFHAHRLARIAQNIINDLSQSFVVREKKIFISVSIGIATSTGCGTNPETLIKSADLAMYAAKEKGKANYQFFTSSLHAQAQQRMTLEQDLQTAWKEQQFLVYYQPMMEVATEKIMGVEVVLRWQHPTQDLILPEVFIPVAESMGLIPALEEWMLFQACHQLKMWQEKYHINLSISLHVGTSLEQSDLLTKIPAILQKTKIAPKQLALIVSEERIANNAQTMTVLQALYEGGVMIILDDFGVSHTSLSHLTTMPVHGVKVADPLISQAVSDSKTAILVTAMIGLAKNLGLHILAKGVTTQEQVAFLKSNYCDWVQGVYWSAPVSREKFEKTVLLRPEQGVH